MGILNSAWLLLHSNQQLDGAFHWGSQVLYKEAARHEFWSQLEQVRARAVHGRGTENCVGTPKSPKFDGTATWSVFRRQFKALAEHKCWTRQNKFTYLITALQGRNTDVLNGIPKGATYEEYFRSWRIVSENTLSPHIVAN
jgi:hypothetical protein